MTRLTLRRDDGARLYITIDGRKGQGYLSMFADDGLPRREYTTLGPAQTDRAIREWHAGRIDHYFPVING